MSSGPNGSAGRTRVAQDQVSDSKCWLGGCSIEHFSEKNGTEGSACRGRDGGASVKSKRGGVQQRRLQDYPDYPSPEINPTGTVCCPTAAQISSSTAHSTHVSPLSLSPPLSIQKHLLQWYNQEVWPEGGAVGEGHGGRGCLKVQYNQTFPITSSKKGSGLKSKGRQYEDTNTVQRLLYVSNISSLRSPCFFKHHKFSFCFAGFINDVC